MRTEPLEEGSGGPLGAQRDVAGGDRVMEVRNACTACRSSWPRHPDCTFDMLFPGFEEWLRTDRGRIARRREENCEERSMNKVGSW